MDDLIARAALDPELYAEETLNALISLRAECDALRAALENFITLREWVIQAGGKKGPLPEMVIEQFRIMSEQAHDAARNALATSGWVLRLRSDSSSIQTSNVTGN